MTERNFIYAGLFKPKSLQLPHAWVGHIPFAAWIIQEAAPQIFVELGTHSGNSYFAMCQSVADANLETKCFAVDTWQGDEHAGKYTDDVFNAVNTHNADNYAEFSQLMRTTFDEAIEAFANHSVELLHIDGLHTYEAVKHDFETWLPKLAPGAVVMFHDTNVHERNFGVWKLWQDLEKTHPSSIEFLHSHGLGVLQLNNAPEHKKMKWLDASKSDKNNFVKFFETLASREAEKNEVNHLLHRVDHLTQLVTARDLRISEILNSSSWRLSSPLRALKQLFKSK